MAFLTGRQVQYGYRYKWQRMMGRNHCALRGPNKRMCGKAIPDFLLPLSTLCSELTAPFPLQILVPADPPQLCTFTSFMTPLNAV